MAWRPNKYLLEGELNNTEPGHVRGWLRFAGIDTDVQLDLLGDFHRDIRGARIRLKGTFDGDDEDARRYMNGFCTEQTGKAGDITAGLPPFDYVDYPYVEWYDDDNGRVVLELEPHQVEVVGTPIPWQTTEPISRADQMQNLTDFLRSLPVRIRPREHAAPKQ
jgi:hypothetical protein